MVLWAQDSRITVTWIMGPDRVVYLWKNIHVRLRYYNDTVCPGDTVIVISYRVSKIYHKQLHKSFPAKFFLVA